MKKVLISFLLVFICTIAFVPSIGAASADVADSATLQLQPSAAQTRANQQSTNSLDFGDEVFQYTITALNRIWRNKDAIQLEITTRDGTYSAYSYTLTYHFFDIDDVEKEPEALCYENIAHSINRTYECQSSWAWACDYVNYTLTISFSGTNQTVSGRLYFWG